MTIYAVTITLVVEDPNGLRQLTTPEEGFIPQDTTQALSWFYGGNVAGVLEVEDVQVEEIVKA